MRANRQPPSMMDLCEIFRKRKEFMWNQNQSISEHDETPSASSEPSSTPPVVNERKHTMETLQTGRERPLRSTKTRRSTKTHESRISYSLAEKEWNFPFCEKRNGLQFPIAETATEFYESEAVESSSDEEFYAFDDGDARPGPLQNQHLYRMKARNAELYRTACDKMSPPQRDEERIPMRQREMAREGKQSRDRFTLPSKPSSGVPRQPVLASYTDLKDREVNPHHVLAGVADKKFVKKEILNTVGTDELEYANKRILLRGSEHLSEY
ncbi:hypothetical protein ACROYT_G002066 [Oculina patagonica]